MNKKFLFIILARSGSKGIPHKNIKNFCGKPLVAWTIEEAKKSKYCQTLVLSSDSQKYLKVGEEYGCDIVLKRPLELSNDVASSIDALTHVINNVSGYDYIVLLQPTSPFRTVEDIDKAIEYMLDNKRDSCVSVCETKESPYWMYELKKSGELSNIIKVDENTHQRQLLPKSYVLNGAIYINKISSVIKEKSLINNHTLGYVMSQSKSLDLDTDEDWKIAEFMFNDCKK